MVSIGLQQLYCAEDLCFCQAGAEHGAQRLLVARLGGGRAAERAERVGEDHARALKERGKLLTGRLGGFQLQQKGGARGGAALGDQAEQLARALVVLADGPAGGSLTSTQRERMVGSRTLAFSAQKRKAA